MSREIKIDTRASCAIAAIEELLGLASAAPIGSGAYREAWEAQAAVRTAIGTYAEILWKAGLITYGDHTSSSAAHAVRSVLTAIADEADPRKAEWRAEKTYAAHVAREAAKPTPV